MEEDPESGEFLGVLTGKPAASGRVGVQAVALPEHSAEEVTQTGLQFRDPGGEPEQPSCQLDLAGISASRWQNLVARPRAEPQME